MPAASDGRGSLGPSKSSSGNCERVLRLRRKFNDRFDTIRISQPPNASGFWSVLRLVNAFRKASCVTSKASWLFPSRRYDTATACR